MNDIKFEEYFKVQIDGELRSVRFTVSDRGHPKMSDYGDDYYYMHFTTNETKVTPTFYEDLLFFLGIAKSKNKRLKNMKYKVNMVLDQENVGLYVRVNEKEPYSHSELEQLLEGVLEFFENKYNIDEMIEQEDNYGMTGIAAGGFAAQEAYNYDAYSSEINSADYNSEVSTHENYNEYNFDYQEDRYETDKQTSHHDYRKNIGALQQSDVISEINSSDREELLNRIEKNAFKDEILDHSSNEDGRYDLGNYDIEDLEKDIARSVANESAIKKEDFATVNERALEELNKMGIGESLDIPLNDPDDPDSEDDSKGSSGDKGGDNDADDFISKFLTQN